MSQRSTKAMKKTLLICVAALLLATLISFVFLATGTAPASASDLLQLPTEMFGAWCWHPGHGKDAARDWERYLRNDMKTDVAEAMVRFPFRIKVMSGNTRTTLSPLAVSRLSKKSAMPMSSKALVRMTRTTTILSFTSLK